MAEENVISVNSVSKKYCRTLKHTMFYGATDLARSFAGFTPSGELLRKGEFWALQDVNIELARGECLGLIGPNGSGKSTLLKMLNGIFMPDHGEIRVKGRVGALIEVGAGFHPLLTGRENIYVNGAILGMSKKEIDREFDSIIDFAGIEDFIDSPVKHYSSGMYVRLGFAVAAHLRPDILLIDEVLAVGDLSFQIKCLNHIQALLGNGTSVLFVSHNLYQVQRICNSAVLVADGRVYEKNNTERVISDYEERYGMASMAKGVPEESSVLVFRNAEIVSEENQEVDGYYRSVTGQPLVIELCYALNEHIDSGVQIGFLIKTADGQRVFGGTTRCVETLFPGDAGEYRMRLEFPSSLLLQGNYQISFSAFDGKYARQLGAWERSILLRVTTTGYNGLHAIGCVQMPCLAYLVDHGTDADVMVRQGP